jgi:hypothetical protein
MDIAGFMQNLAYWTISPIHELGHVVFGWLSFNPTFITGWAEASTLRDEFIVSVGGVLGEELFLVWISEMLAWKARKKATWWAVVATLAIIIWGGIPGGGGDIQYDQHFPGSTNLGWAIYYLGFIAAIIVCFHRRERAWSIRRSRKRQSRLIMG